MIHDKSNVPDVIKSLKFSRFVYIFLIVALTIVQLGAYIIIILDYLALPLPGIFWVGIIYFLLSMSAYCFLVNYIRKLLLEFKRELTEEFKILCKRS